MSQLYKRHWFEEAGELARAEFIRVQIQLAKFDTDLKLPPFDLELGLVQRENELLRATRPGQWSNFPVELCGQTPMPLWTFRRGFVAEITCTWEEWAKHADAILAQQPIERVTLTTMPEFTNGERLRNYRECVDTWDGLGSRDPIRDFLLHKRWPRIAFSLPTATGVAMRQNIGTIEYYV